MRPAEVIGAALGLNVTGLDQEYAVVHQESRSRRGLSVGCEGRLPGLHGGHGLVGAVRRAKLVPGDTALLQGTGGESLLALQLAKAAGMETVTTSSPDEKLERARAHGVDHVFKYRAATRWSETARRLNGGRGVDFVLDMGAEGSFVESLHAVGMGGYVAVVGMLGQESILAPATMLASAARVKGVTVGSRDLLEALCCALALHRIRPIVSDVRPWTEARDALRSQQSHAHFGKIVLTF